MRVQNVDSSAGHNANTTTIYAHVLNQSGKGVQSSIDKLLSAILQNLQCWGFCMDRYKHGRSLKERSAW